MRSALVVVLLMSGLHAQEAPGPQVPHIRVVGEAVVSAPPDQAAIELGVVTEAPTAQAAVAENARRLANVLGQLRKLLGESGEIRTAGYSLSPNFRHPRDGGKPEITGYTASNLVQVKVSDLTRVGAVIDAAIGAGANVVERLRFTLRDETALRKQALAEATRNARARAEAIAAAAGLKIVQVLSLQEGGLPEIRPAREMLLAAASPAAAPTQVEAGAVEVQARVSLLVQVTQ